VGEFLTTLVGSVESGLILFFILMLVRWLLRRDWAAILLVLVLVTLQNVSLSHQFDLTFFLSLGFMALIIAALLYVLLHFGLLAGIVGFFTANILLTNPLTLTLSAWYSPSTLFAAAAVLAIAGLGFYLSVDRTRWRRFDLD
jgi:hypothetical protein